MDPPALVHSQSHLCEVCTGIDFKSIAQAAQLCSKPLSQERRPFNHDLGTIEDISQREERCAFCKILAKYLRRTCLDLVGRCMIQCDVNMCISSTRAPFSQDGPHTHTTAAWVQFCPDNALSWVPLPWEIESQDSHLQGVRQIFQLQAGNVAASNGTQLEQEINPRRITGRLVLPFIDMELPRKWFLTCEREHIGRCPHSSTSPDWETGFMPTFVVDVTNLCITDTPRNCRYVALSYVWGRGKMLKHMKEKSNFLCTPGSLRTLEVPKTISDAIYLVGGIGEQYLWVDALCITQDDIGMQQAQIAKMDRIYAKALFSIIAAHGDSAKAGLPGINSNHREQVQDVLRLPDGDFFTVISGGTDVIRKSIWAQRAWTMQELLCSGRCLIFAESQVYWRCQSAVWLEEIALEDTASTDLEILHPAAAARLPGRRLNSYDYFYLYYQLLGSYIHRRLTYQSDLINAFSGVCARLSTVQDDRFFWGLPESRFSRSLGWRLYGVHARNYARTQLALPDGVMREVPFPSWNWAAWIGENDSPWLNFLQSNTNDANGDEFQPVVDFWISEASGILVPISEPGRHAAPSTQDAQRRFPWQGLEWQLPKALGGTGPTSVKGKPGFLYFWTSVVQFEIREFGDLGLELHYLFPERLERHSYTCSELRELWQKWPSQTSDLATLGFVVVCRTDDARSGQDLIVLTVKWVEGVAYRLGAQKIPENDWQEFKHREWKFVILG